MKIKRILNLALAGVILTITASAQKKVKKTKEAKPQDTGCRKLPMAKLQRTTEAELV
jgi:hypothetical protein